MRENKVAYYLLLILLLATPVVLLALIWLSPDRLIYDENNFVTNIPLLGQYGLSTDFVRLLKNQSPGPLYQLIYYPLGHLGITTITGYRVVNLLLLCGCMGLQYRLMKAEGVDDALVKSLLLLSVPLTWPTGGLALTEVPTMFFALSSLWLLQLAMRRPRHQVLLSAGAGLLLGLTVAGRTPFLMVLPAAAYVYAMWRSMGKPAVLAYFIPAVALPAAMFYIWKGLVPPDVQQIQAGLNPLFLAYAYGYTCFFLLIFYPGWYRVPAVYYKAMAVLLFVFFLLNVQFSHFEFLPMKSIFSRLPGGGAAAHYFALLMPCIMVTLGVLHIIALALHAWTDRSNVWAIFLLLTATLIAATTIKSAAQFSTRYPYQAVPFLLLYCAPYIKINPGLVARVCIGLVLGCISLLGYYRLHYS